MGRNLVVFADGTGNDRARGEKTNVAKLADLSRNMRVVPGNPAGPKPWQDLAGQELDAELAHPEIEQLTHYVVGVGSSWGDLLGQATGGGISDRILDGYDFIVRFYEPGDRIWLFGFSRGAYTARSLGGLIGMCGVPERGHGGTDLRHDAQARGAILRQAYAVYRTGSGLGEPGRVLRLAAAKQFRDAYAYPAHKKEDAARAPYFIGVWDTVRSLGIPIYRYELELPWWQYLFHDAELNPHVAHAYHALSLDDTRIQFHPTLWNEPTLAARAAAENGTESQQSFEQVWFPGVHADVGGGYAESGLSDVTLSWMIERALRPQHPLLFNGPDPGAGLAPDPNGPLHDSRSGVFKKLIYQSTPRSVVKGIQDVESRSMARRSTTKADLHESWSVRLTSVGSTYDTPHLRGHPDYDKLRPPKLP